MENNKRKGKKAMIHVYGKYYLETDKYNFIIGVKRKGKLKDPHYYSTLSDAITAVRRFVIREGMNNIDGELIDAVAACKRLSDAFAETVSKITECIG